MGKERLIKLAKKLRQEAFEANGYFLIMEQYQKLQEEYSKEINISPAFYQTVYLALKEACFMKIAKLYDMSGDAVTIGSLLKECEKNISLFPEYPEPETIEIDGEKIITQDSYRHWLKQGEECFFKDRVDKQRKLCKEHGIPSSEMKVVLVELSFPEFLEYYQKKYTSFSKKIENIRESRNRKYAHNDEKQFMGVENFIEKHPVFYTDIRDLINFALDCTDLILVTLTDIGRARNLPNIDDWKNTLSLVRKGMKYQDREWERLEEQLTGKTETRK